MPGTATLVQTASAPAAPNNGGAQQGSAPHPSRRKRRKKVVSAPSDHDGAGAEQPGAPANKGQTAPAPGSAAPAIPPATPAAKITITAVRPSGGADGGSQVLTVDGQNFVSDLTAILNAPDGSKVELASDKITVVSVTRVVLVASLGLPGTWKLSLAPNAQGSVAAVAEFSVYTTRLPVRAYWYAFWAITVTLALLFVLMVVSLSIAMWRGHWSLADALSEEATYQPREILVKGDIIMIASTSRLIALLGLLGILTTVLGIGYSIIWNLFVRGVAPELASVRSFLFGAACLFAPYLANQAKLAFRSSGGAGEPGKSGAAVPRGPAIAGVSPGQVVANAAVQTVRFTGSGFRPAAAVMLTDPTGVQDQVAAAHVDSIDPTLITVTVTLATPGVWKVTVTNPNENPGPPYGFAVSGPPAITRIDPAAITNDPATRDFAFIGSGFMSNCTVVLTNPAGAVVASAVAGVTSTRVNVRAALNAAGPWSVIISNGTNASQPFTFTVA